MAQTKAQLLGPVVGDVTIDASTLSLDAENNKVGIGTTEADLRLHVNGPNALPSSSGSTATGHLTLRDKAGSATHGMFMGVSDASPWSSWIQAQDSANNATNYPLLLNPNGGNVGIGTDNPGNANLAVVNTAQAAFSIGQNVDGSGSNHLGMWYGTGLGSPAGADIFTSNGNMSFWVDGAGGSGSSIEFGNGFGAAGGGANWMTINSSGKVGIGVTNPEDYDSEADDLVINSGGADTGITLVTGSDVGSHGSIFFADGTGTAGAKKKGQIRYEQNNEIMSFHTNEQQRLTIDLNGNVGIGENSPDVRLHVKEQFDTAYSLANVADEANHLLKLENPSTTANAFSGMQFRVGSGADLFFGAIQQTTNHGDFFFANQNSPQKEMMRIKSTGNIGINNSDPLYPLHFKNAMASTPSYIHMEVTGTNTVGGGGGIAFDTSTSNNASNNSLYLATIAGIRNSEDNGSNDLIFSTTHSNVNNNLPTEKLRITSDGKVGIGIDNPISKICVEGTGNASTGATNLGTTAAAAGLFLKTHSGSSTGLALGGRDTGGQYIQAEYTASTVVSVRDLSINPYGGGVAIGVLATAFGGNPGADTILLGTSQIERFRITSSGLVRVGHPTANHSSNVTQDLEIKGRYVNGVGDFSRLIFGNSDDSGGSTASIRAERNGNNYGTELKFFTNPQSSSGDGLERLRITRDGDVGIGTPPYVVLEAAGTSGTHGDAVYNMTLAGTTYAWDNAASGAGILFSGKYNSAGETTTYGFISAKKENTTPSGDGENGAFLTLGTRPNGGTPTERLRIESVGRVSIGLGQDCNNFGNNFNALQIHSSSGQNSYLSLTNSTTGTNGTSVGLNLIQTGVNALVNNRSVGWLAFQTSDLERLHISSGGDVRMGALSFGDPKTKLDIIEDQTIPFGITASTGTFVGVMVRTRYYLEFSIEFPQHSTNTSIALKFSRSSKAPSISIDYFSSGGYQVDHGVTGVAYISFYASNGATLYSGTNHQSAYGGAYPSWSHGNGTTDVVFKLSNIAYSNPSMCHFRINMPRGGINNVTVDRTTP